MIQSKMREVQEALRTLGSREATMKGLLQEFNADYVTQKAKAEKEEASATGFCTRIPVEKFVSFVLRVSLQLFILC